jgi:prevent-host-death family protein
MASVPDEGKPVNVHDAKTHFSKLLERVAKGEEVVIAKAGKPVARLVPVVQPPPPRKFGTLRGMVTIPEDFDAADPEIEAMFNGEDPDDPLLR